MRRTLVRIGYFSAIVFIGEAILAIGSATTLEIFRLWIGFTSVFLLVGAVLARFAGPAGRLSDMQMANYQVSSGTKPLWDMSRPSSPNGVREPFRSPSARASPLARRSS